MGVSPNEHTKGVVLCSEADLIKQVLGILSRNAVCGELAKPLIST